MTGCHDPDVVPTNRSGVRLELLCHPASAADVYQGLGVSQLLATATRVTNNTYEPLFLFFLILFPIFPFSCFGSR